MQRPRCSAKLPKTYGFTSPTTRSGSSLIRAVAVCAPRLGAASAAMSTAANPVRRENRRCRFIASAPFREPLPADDSGSLADDDELVGGHGGDLLRLAAGPANGEVGGGGGAEPEVQAPVVGRVEARLRRHLLGLVALAVARDHARADRAAVALDALEQHLEPVPAARDVVAEQRGRLVHVHDGEV